MKGVAVMGKRGGTGKTTLANLLAYGACWKGVPAYLMHTDDRDPMIVNGRPYMYYDARKPDVLANLIEAACNGDGLCVIDSGGNRPEFDTWIAGAMDILLLPIAPDPEDIRVNIQHLEQLDRVGGGNAFLIINKMPGGPQEREFVKRYLRKVPKDRTLCWLPEIKAVRLMREDDGPEGFQTPPARVNNLARNLYVAVADHLRRKDDQQREAA